MPASRWCVKFVEQLQGFPTRGKVWQPQKTGIEYQTLFDSFLSGGLSATEFQEEYLDRFKKEEKIGAGLFDALETVFDEIESCTTDSELLTGNPDFYLDEIKFRGAN
ncbi:colicin immunity domain-containing protein [Variovorax saccharolyticus]|uniref:colicin immunity domain-containing protein n=1 Tax=Variovorax saccharolyticus TaxID=3053516 RepID=UPI002576D594|nr:colicin immunity domain-containing protein [Variovorax sp. J31P216]MDM0030482.1 colicin immunity domain-containing protein [Variovorax sp. J31P216]